jgi:hypothetical protein
MSRSGYSEDYYGPELNLYRGAVASAIKGKRGQAFIKEAIVAFDAMKDKRIITDSLHEPKLGEYCTLGVIGASRGMDLKSIEYAEPEGIAKAFGISKAMTAEIMFENDECDEYPSRLSNPEKRWLRMRNWLVSNLNV